jgi:hypothetical protein
MEPQPAVSIDYRTSTAVVSALNYNATSWDIVVRAASLASALTSEAALRYLEPRGHPISRFYPVQHGKVFDLSNPSPQTSSFLWSTAFSLKRAFLPSSSLSRAGAFSLDLSASNASATCSLRVTPPISKASACKGLELVIACS